MDPLSTTILTTSCISATAIVGTVTLTIADKIAACFESFLDSFYHYDTVGIGNGDLWLSLLLWVHRHMDLKQRKMLVSATRKLGGAGEVSEQVAIPIPGRHMVVDLKALGLGRVWIRTLPEFKGKITGTCGFQVFIGAEFINRFWVHVMESACVMDKAVIDRFKNFTGCVSTKSNQVQ